MVDGDPWPFGPLIGEENPHSGSSGVLFVLRAVSPPFSCRQRACRLIDNQDRVTSPVLVPKVTVDREYAWPGHDGEAVAARESRAD